MARKTAQNFIQFSKRLATYVMVFWGAYRLLSLVLVLFRPEVATALAALTAGIDDLAMVNVISYTANSATEKVTVSYFANKAAERKGMYAEEEEEEENG